MKRTTLWKLAAAVLLVAVTLPIFSAVAPPTQVTAATTVPPLPYAMEQYGQHHSGIYFTEAAPAIDGTRDASYTLMDAFTDSAGQFNGVFLAAAADGTGAGEENDEWVADKLDIYGAYDSTYVYFYVETISRTDASYSITPKFGFNFSTSQKDAQEGKALPPYEVTEAAGQAGDGANWIAKTARTTPGNDSSSGYTDYDRNATIYEFRVAWADIVPEGKRPELDFDRMYMSLVMPFLSNGTKYWIYGVPNNALLPNDTLVGDAFGSEAGTYTPNVVNLLGIPYDEASYPAPLFLSFERTDKNTNANRNFRISYTVTGADKADIEETGVLFTPDASTIAERNMTLQTQGIQILSATLDSEADGVLTYTATFSTTDADYEKYFTLRPYVKYKGEGAPTVYADYYSNTPSYYDALNSEYNRYLKVLMIGCSFSSYYKDELIALCKAEGIHLTLGRVYYSGMRSHEHWDWLLNDFEEDGLKGELRSATGTIYSYTPRTVKEVLHFVDDWDVIAMQDHYGISFSIGDTYAAGMDASMPYMANLFRYLRVNFPESDLYIHQTWAFQLGYGYKNGSAILNEDGTKVIGGSVNGTSFAAESSRMMTVEQQTNHHNNIMKITNSLSEKMGVPMIPSGSAWAIARAHELIGDHLCDGKNGEAAGDYYHDGEGGGGQYLNACVWYEIITGNDVTKAKWKPVDYEMSDAKANAIREVAHQAVEEYKETASWKNQTINK